MKIILCHFARPSELSIEGEKYVDEAVRKALYGVKQMKDIMAKNEEKHEHLMKSLKHSSDKKKVRQMCCVGQTARVYCRPIEHFTIYPCQQVSAV